jgi:hypothetical protein
MQGNLGAVYQFSASAPKEGSDACVPTPVTSATFF